MQFKSFMCSPLSYALAGYAAILIEFVVQVAAPRGMLVPGSLLSDILPWVLAPLAVLAPVFAICLATWNLAHKSRERQSALTIFASAPLVLLTVGVITRYFYLRGIAA